MLFRSLSLFPSHDTAPSTNAAIDAAYTFTTAQAGIGVYLDTRSVGDPVNNGRTVHSGKLPYYRYLDAAVRSSKQGERSGAATVYYPVLDPELSDLIKAKNIKTQTRSVLTLLIIHYKQIASSGIKFVRKINGC